jgi:hypothetical protein
MAPTASPDPAFQALMKLMQTQSAEIAAYLQGFAQQRPWMLPPVDAEGWDGDPTNLEDIKKAFDRSVSNEAYKEALHNGTSAEAAAHNLQIAYVSVMERAFRARHRTVCRSVAHSSARRKGQGQDGGTHVGQVLQFIQDLLLSGTQA